MIYKATKLIAQALEQENIHPEVNDLEKFSEVNVGYEITNGPAIEMRFMSANDNNDTTAYIFRLIRDIPEEKEYVMQKAINECNAKFSYAKFSLDKDRDINIKYDFPQCTADDCLGDIACEICYRLFSIADKSYPILMKALWS